MIFFVDSRQFTHQTPEDTTQMFQLDVTQRNIEIYQCWCFACIDLKKRRKTTGIQFKLQIFTIFYWNLVTVYLF